MIYASTSCLKYPKNVLRVLEEYEKAGIKNVELGSVHDNFDIKELFRFNFNFTIHNYFPPPKVPFNFNLASINNSIRQRSIELAKAAIDLCCKIESPLYTFHAGFAVDPDKLGKRFMRKNIVDRKLTISTFIESVKELITYAKKRGIRIAMEPNVVEEFNLVNGKNELLLFAEYPEIELLFTFIKNDEIGILLDLGHTAVTSHWLKYDKDYFVDQCSDKVVAIHLSNNNGLKDQHKSLTKECWQVSKLDRFKNIPIILETMNLSVDQIKSNISLVSNIIK